MIENMKDAIKELNNNFMIFIVNTTKVYLNFDFTYIYITKFITNYTNLIFHKFTLYKFLQFI